MELTEVLSRVFGRHRLLVIGLVLLGLVGGLARHWADKPDYRGTARLIVTSSEPTSSSEATAIADTVRALATGPALVREALNSIHVDRDAASVAANAVSVRSFGSSGVVELRVTDRDPGVALRLTAAIAKAVVDQRVNAASAGLEREIGTLQRQIDELRPQVSALDQRLNELSVLAGSQDPSVANSAIAKRDQLLAQRSSITDQIAALTSNQSNLTGELAAQSPAAIVDPPESPATRVSAQRLPDIALGGLLGLILAVALAAALETLRPTVVGRAAIARSLQTAVLGEVRRSGNEWNPDDILEAASNVGLAAAGASVKRIDFLSAAPQVNVPLLAASVSEELTHLSVEVATPGTIVGRVASPEENGNAGRARRPAPVRGLVLVVPDAVKLADLEPARDFLAICGWPLLGVIITQRGGPLTLVRREPSATPMTSEATA